MRGLIRRFPSIKSIKNILFQGVRYTFEADSHIISLGSMFGFLKEKNNTVVIANRIFETKLYNFFTDVSSSDY